MALATFADTSGFYALLVKGDAMHARARAVLERSARSGSRFLTTEYVLDETATLLKARGHGHLADAFFDRVFASAAETTTASITPALTAVLPETQSGRYLDGLPNGLPNFRLPLPFAYESTGTVTISPMPGARCLEA